MAKIDYFKSSDDISSESFNWDSNIDALLQKQSSLSRFFDQGPLRENCILCNSCIVDASLFSHRGMSYKFCPRCSHLQTSYILPKGFPFSVSSYGFDSIYPDLSSSEYISRRDRIYMPKLKWFLKRVELAGIAPSQCFDLKFLEFGCGSGYFLHSLIELGFSNVLGIDAHPTLVANANHHCGFDVATVSCDLYNDLSDSDANIFAGFFVLEHLEDPGRFWSIMSSKPPGTLLFFSVPMFSLCTMIESAITDFPARNLDNAVHTQLYTDQSIDFILNESGFSKVSEWIFGQDSNDLVRMIIRKLAQSMPPDLLSISAPDLIQLVDPFQKVVDHLKLSDSRHILAVKY